MGYLVFTDAIAVIDYKDVQNAILNVSNIFRFMLKERIDFAPSAFESGFMSLAHGVEEI